MIFSIKKQHPFTNKSFWGQIIPCKRMKDIKYSSTYKDIFSAIIVVFTENIFHFLIEHTKKMDNDLISRKPSSCLSISLSKQGIYTLAPEKIGISSLIRLVREHPKTPALVFFGNKKHRRRVCQEKCGESAKKFMEKCKLYLGFSVDLCYDNTIENYGRMKNAPT